MSGRRAGRSAIVAAALALAAPSLVPIAVAADAKQVSWLARIESATACDAPRFQKLELTVQPTLEVGLGERWRLRGIARLRLDAAGELDVGDSAVEARARGSRQLRFAAGRGEIELRELYVDGAVGATQWRIGRQQIVWGQADGLRVLDVVNPVSFREFVLPNAEDRRIPVWATNAELPLGSGTLQVLWIPDPTFDEVPGGAHPFAVTTPLLVPAAPPRHAGAMPVAVSLAPVDRPAGLLDSSDVGLRWSGQAGGWDLTLNALHHYWDVPVPYRRAGAGGARIEPRPERTTMLGGSYASSFGAVTLRGEIGLSTRRFFVTSDPGDADGVFEARELAHVVGLDWTGIENTLVSAQFFQSRISRRPDGATRRRVEDQVTLLVQHEALNQSLRLRALWLQSLDRGDRTLQAQVAWKWRSNAIVTLGVERFAGTREGLFGQFRDASRATLALEVGF